MEKATRQGIPAVMTAGRFELVDHEGRVRAVVGDLSGPVSGWYPGVALLDENGHERVQLVLTDSGPLLSFAEEGSVVLEQGVADMTNPEVQTPGPFVVLCERGGEAMLGVRVKPDGEAVLIDRRHRSPAAPIDLK